MPPLRAAASRRERIPGADVTFIGILKGNAPFTFLSFKFLRLPESVPAELRRGDSPRAFPYTRISCANADKKRLNVNSLASFPVASRQAALALLTLCLFRSMAARTASLSERFITGFRPRPGRVCRPVMPSERKRFTHAFFYALTLAIRAFFRSIRNKFVSLSSGK
jgi:hypothetical protein